MKKLIIEIEDKLKRKLDIKCAQTGKNKKEIITMLIRHWLGLPQETKRIS